MLTRLSTFAVAIGLALTSMAGAQTPFQPVAVVNDSVITGFDLAQRVRLLQLLGARSEDPERLRNFALDQLIHDRLKMQAAERAGVEATPERIEQGIAGYAERTEMAPDEFRAALSANGVAEQALVDLVAPQMVWPTVVTQRYGSRVSPGEADIDAEIDLMRERVSQSYRLREIGLAEGDRGRNEAETRALAERLYRDLSQGGDFGAAVARYSRAPSAREGGDLGWIEASSLPPGIAETLAGLEPGDVTPPMRVTGGYSLLKLVDRRSDSPDSVDASDAALREQVRRELVDQRLERLAEGLLQELRRDALIEVR